MAITNAQQYKQLLAKGGRIGFKGGADMGTVDAKDSKGNVTRAATNKASDLKVGAGGASFNKDDNFQTLSTIDSDVRDRQKKNYEKQFYDKGQVPPLGSRPTSFKTKLDQRNKQKRLDYINYLQEQIRNKLNKGLIDYQEEEGQIEGLTDFDTLESYIDKVQSVQDLVDKGFYKSDGQFAKGEKIPDFSATDMPGLLSIAQDFFSGPVTSDKLKQLNEQLTTLEGLKTTEGLEGTSMNELMKEYQPNRFKLENPPTGGDNASNQDPCKGPNPPAYCFVNQDPTTPDPTPTRNLGGLAPRFAGSIFDFTGLADGGRAGFAEGGEAEGGGIEARLKQLGGDVSSAEKMLQGINERLQTAESSLGSGGGISGLIPGQPIGTPGAIGPNMLIPQRRPGGEGNIPNQMPPGFGTRPLLSSTIDPNFKPVEELKSVQPGDPSYKAPGPTTLNGVVIDNPNTNNAFSSVEEAFANAQKEAQKTRKGGFAGQVVLPGEMSFEDFSNFYNPSNPLGQVGLSPIQQAVGMADGGRVPAMDGGIMNADVIGGAADGNIDEMGRQMYFVGKLVKKATRAVKKVAKSPLGKAALIGGGLGLAGIGPFKGLAGTKFGTSLGSFFGKGSFNPFKTAIKGVGKVSSPFGALASKFGLTDLITGDMTLGGKIGLGFGIPLALDLLGVGKDDDDKMDLDEYYKTQGINVADIRLNPYKYLSAANQGSLYAANGGLMRMGYQEGGDAEPVAKKTMPLIDMDGKEKDYRETGGFVDMGRMERADDVPARLSKNEFVFTADAVRNAGEGDIDKGAEVMYNMMKNLEAGGEVSEESQGLEGAREMFQTSQRLGEVI